MRTKITTILLCFTLLTPILALAQTQDKQTLIISLLRKVLELQEKIIELGGAPIQLPPGLAAIMQGGQPKPSGAVAPLSDGGLDCEITSTLARGSRGTEVTCLQRFLISQNLLPGDSVTGLFGALTESAVRKFQLQNNLESVGHVGRLTRSAIQSKQPPLQGSARANSGLGDSEASITAPASLVVGQDRGSVSGSGTIAGQTNMGGGGGGSGGGNYEKSDTPRATARPAPTCSISSNPSSVVMGAATKLSWVTSDADRVTLNQTAVAFSGESTVSPSATTIYSMSATGNGTALCETTVTITTRPAPLGVSFTSLFAAPISKSVTLTASSTGESQVVGVQFKIDGTNIGEEDTAPPYALTWNSAATTNGSHTLYAVARDIEGSRATTTLAVTVSNTCQTAAMRDLLLCVPFRTSGTTVTLGGFYTDGDGGGGQFQWNPGTAVHDGGTVLSPTAVPGTSSWLNPATTTGHWKRLNVDQTLDARWFGIFGDGVTDHTLPLLKFTKLAGQNRKSILMPSGTYRAKLIRLYNGTPSFLAEGTIKGTGTPDPNGLLQIDGPKLQGSPVTGITVTANIDMSSGDTRAIYAAECNQCTFTKNNIYGFVSDPSDQPNDSTKYKYGILLDGGSSRNTITDNIITGSFNPPARQMLIDILSKYDTGVEYAGYFSNSGSILPPTKPAQGNVIARNTLTNGSYGVNMIGASGGSIAYNTMSGQNHRGIAFYHVNSVLVKSNTVTDYKSSGILMGYGSNNNTVQDNTFKDVQNPYGMSDEASININTGSSGNIIASNTVNSERTYGAYLAVGVQNNQVFSNRFSSFNRAGIALEGDWEDTPPADARYSRTNFGPASAASSVPNAQWAYTSTSGNIISGNTINASHPYRDTVGIYVAQINAPSPGITRAVSGNTITDNRITSSALTHYLYVYSMDPAMMSSNTISGNSFPTADASKVVLPTNF